MQKFKGLYIFFFLISIFVSKISVSQSAVAISLNEYQVTNTTNSNLDNYFQPSDWIELYNNYTGTVSLSGYWLSNERANLKKWQFPSTFTMTPGMYSIVWMSGRNETKIVNGLHHMHTNFNIDQCKNQWIILTAPNGVVRDSIFVKHTQENHTRGRLNGANADFQTVGIYGWRVYTTPTFSAINNQNPYIDYCPTPVFTEPAGMGAITSPSFEIYHTFAGQVIDTSCFEVWFTTDGSYPKQGGSVSFQYIDGATPLIPPPTTMMMYRAATFPKSTATVVPAVPPTWCETNWLPSFCETNTYFCEPGVLETDFSTKFGVLSIATTADNPNWFLVGTPATSAHVEYFEMQSPGVKRFVTEGYALMTKGFNDIIGGNESWLAFQKGFNLNIDDRRGFGCNFESPIFNVPELGTSTRTLFPTLQVYGGDLEAHSAPASNTLNPSCGTGLRDVFLQTLAAKYDLKVNPLHIKPIAVFMDAKYIGTFNFKEVFDPYYEEFYNKQTQKDKTSMLFYHNGEGFVQTTTVTNNWKGVASSDLYTFASSYPFNTVSGQISSYYNTLKTRLDIPNFIDWNIINSYSQNSNLYNYNIAMAKGSNSLTTGGKWHHYLWNMPSVFQFSCITQNGFYNSPISSPCAISQSTYPLSPNAYNGQGIIFYNLMNKNGGNAEFRRDYIMRYQDLLNGPLSCDKILKHWDDINLVYRDQYKKHEDPGTTPVPGAFVTQTDQWDTNMSILRRNIQARCVYMEKAFAQTTGCYGLIGPYDITVEIKPAGAGTVKLNTIVLPYYTWAGKFFKGPMSLKARPIDTTFVFDHWELENHVEANARPLSLDSIGINFAVAAGEKVVAVFTDRKEEAALPSGFSPNGDGKNDVFGILGSGKYSYEYSLQIWNRWGQEVFRTTDPLAGWDGNFNGALAQTGVYAYFISYKNLYNETKTLKGNVTLVR